jgi:hypothetical protein
MLSGMAVAIKLVGRNLINIDPIKPLLYVDLKQNFYQCAQKQHIIQNIGTSYNIQSTLTYISPSIVGKIIQKCSEVKWK